MEKMPELDKVARILEETLRTMGPFGISKPMCGRLRTIVMQLNGNYTITNARNGLRMAEVAIDVGCRDLKLNENVANKNHEQVEVGLHEVKCQLDHWLDYVKYEIDHVLHQRVRGTFERQRWSGYCEKLSVSKLELGLVV